MSRQRREKEAAEVRPPINWFRVVSSAALFLAVGIYCVRFHSTPRAVAIWSQLLWPEQMLTDMWAGDLRYFGLLDRAPIVLVAVAILSAAVAIGRGLLRAIGICDSFQPSERNVLAVLLGLAGLSWATLLFGLAGLLHAWYLPAATIATLAACGAWVLYRDFCNRQRKSNSGPFVQACFAIGVFFTALSLSTAILPPWDFDVLEYHLQAPKEWLQAGRIEFLPHNVYASMPLAAEMLALLPMTFFPGAEGWFSGALVGKFLNACFVPLTALLIYTTGTRVFSRRVGALGAVLYLTTPWMMHVAAHGLNEPAVATYGCAAFVVLMRTEWNTRGAILAGLFAGAAAACKYPALVMLTMPLTVVAALAPRFLAQEQFTAGLIAKRCGAFLIAAALVVGPWFLKNAVQTGNPIYPLLASVFGGETRTAGKNVQFARAHAVPRDADGNRYSVRSLSSAIAAIPWDGGSPILLFAFLIGLLFTSLAWRAEVSRVPLFAVGMIVWISLVWYLATHRIDRFWLPALPFAAILGGLAEEHAFTRFERWAVRAFVAFNLLFLALTAIGAEGDSRRLVRLDLLREGSALHERDIARVSAAFRYLNEHTRADQAVLLVGDAAVFDLRPKAFYNTCFDDSLLPVWMEDRSATERHGEFHKRQIAFVCVNQRELDRYRSPGNYGYDPRFRDTLLDDLVLQRILELVWTEPQVARPTKIYRVVPASPAK